MSTEQENSQPVEVVQVQPAVAEAQPAVAEAQPAVAEAQPAVAEAQPAVAEAQPAVAEAQPVVPIDTNLDQLIAAINNTIGTGQITALNILSICINLMQIVEKYPKLPGKQKKELVMKALQTAISNKGGDPALMALIPSFIDNAINIENGRVQISFSAQDMVGCCGGCFGNAQK
jgi:hypothetical protein